VMEAEVVACAGCYHLQRLLRREIGRMQEERSGDVGYANARP
jgi:hypothetical protein